MLSLLLRRHLSQPPSMAYISHVTNCTVNNGVISFIRAVFWYHLKKFSLSKLTFEKMPNKNHCPVFGCIPTMSFAQFSSFFGWTMLKKAYFNQHLVCIAPKCLSTYPTPNKFAQLFSIQKLCKNNFFEMAAMPFPCNGTMLCCVNIPYCFSINLLVALSLI